MMTYPIKKRINAKLLANGTGGPFYSQYGAAFWNLSSESLQQNPNDDLSNQEKNQYRVVY